MCYCVLCSIINHRFYEWKKDGSKKQPYYIHFDDDRPLVLAALYDYWENDAGQLDFQLLLCLNIFQRHFECPE